MQLCTTINNPLDPPPHQNTLFLGRPLYTTIYNYIQLYTIINNYIYTTIYNYIQLYTREFCEIFNVFWILQGTGKGKRSENTFKPLFCETDSIVPYINLDSMVRKGFHERENFH